MIAAMKIISNFSELSLGLDHTVVAIGNFDGVHRGHQALLKKARSLADYHGFSLLILTFEPHPRQFFKPDIAPFRITPAPVKAQIFDQLIHPDFYAVMNFDGALAELSPPDFIQDILINYCHAKIIIVGQDFRFGKRRSGCIDTFRARPDFETIVFDVVREGDGIISSSCIRADLQSADMVRANTLLGWEWYIESEVIHGDKRGRTLGFPTANMRFGGAIVPSHGVYAVRVLIEGEAKWRIGAANIGTRPMFATEEPLLETHIFDFDQDIYGKYLKVKPVVKLRDEMKFDSLDALIDQMTQDCAKVREVLHK